jgi:hypothetical protein
MFCVFWCAVEVICVSWFAVGSMVVMYLYLGESGAARRQWSTTNAARLVIVIIHLHGDHMKMSQFEIGKVHIVLQRKTSPWQRIGNRAMHFRLLPKV